MSKEDKNVKLWTKFMKNSIEIIKKEFHTEYELTADNLINKDHGFLIPPIAAEITWLHGLQRTLQGDMAKTRNSFGGDEARNHQEYRQLKIEVNDLQKEIEGKVDNIVEEWENKIKEKTKRELFYKNPILSQLKKKPGNCKFQANVYPEGISFTKEVFHLKRAGIRVPLWILNEAHQINQRYPTASSITKSIEIYESCWRKMKHFAKKFGKEPEEIIPLFLKVEQVLEEGTRWMWHDYRLPIYVENLSKLVSDLANRIEIELN